jgi:hypothetical protein
MPTRIETLTAGDRSTLGSCYLCRCASCSEKREAIAKAIRIIDQHAASGVHVSPCDTEETPKEDDSLKL